MADVWMPLSTASDPNANRRQVAGSRAKTISPRSPTKKKGNTTMSKSTGPVTSRGAAQNPGRGNGFGKTAPGPAQPTPANGRPDGVSRTGKKQGQASEFTPRPKRGNKKIG